MRGEKLIGKRRNENQRKTTKNQNTLVPVENEIQNYGFEMVFSQPKPKFGKTFMKRRNLSFGFGFGFWTPALAFGFGFYETGPWP